mmetsp:Transcript_49931/g.107460  ORF Transcript_49931/g.107460 Transcript_49931/m.107460 type:complete len:307 (+) Transcript_49931:108-1028(+)
MGASSMEAMPAEDTGSAAAYRAAAGTSPAESSSSESTSGAAPQLSSPPPPSATSNTAGLAAAPVATVAADPAATAAAAATAASAAATATATAAPAAAAPTATVFPAPGPAAPVSPTKACRVLQEFALEAEAAPLTDVVKGAFPEELDAIIAEVARTGSTNPYPWEALRHLLARKIEMMLGEMYREKPDVELSEGETLHGAFIEPLMRSMLDPRREGPPFTVQRLCELLAQPRLWFNSTRKYLYALQRTIIITSTEEAVLALPPQLFVSAHTVALQPPAKPVEDATDPPANRKRKLPPELANGAIAE